MRAWFATDDGELREVTGFSSIGRAVDRFVVWRHGRELLSALRLLRASAFDGCSVTVRYREDRLSDAKAQFGDAVQIAEVNYDASGDDGDNLNDEYVVFENTGDAGIDLTDWQVQDEVEKTYTFPTFTLDAGATVTLHTGSGTDTSTDLYWGRGSPVWNNDGDTVYVYDDTGSLVLEYPY